MLANGGISTVRVVAATNLLLAVVATFAVRPSTIASTNGTFYRAPGTFSKVSTLPALSVDESSRYETDDESSPTTTLLTRTDESTWYGGYSRAATINMLKRFFMLDGILRPNVPWLRANRGTHVPNDRYNESTVSVEAFDDAVDRALELAPRRSLERSLRRYGVLPNAVARRIRFVLWDRNDTSTISDREKRLAKFALVTTLYRTDRCVNDNDYPLVGRRRRRSDSKGTPRSRRDSHLRPQPESQRYNGDIYRWRVMASRYDVTTLNLTAFAKFDRLVERAFRGAKPTFRRVEWPDVHADVNVVFVNAMRETALPPFAASERTLAFARPIRRNGIVVAIDIFVRASYPWRLSFATNGDRRSTGVDRVELASEDIRTVLERQIRLAIRMLNSNIAYLYG